MLHQTRRGTALYLDANAGLPLKKPVQLALADFLSRLGPNPSSIHSFGRVQKKILAETREAILKSISGNRHYDVHQVLFASSGTEANQWAISSVLKSNAAWITSNTEHDSVLQMRDLREPALLLPARPDGRIDFDALPSDLPPEVRLLSFVLVNNETGVINDAAKAIEWAKARGVLVHIDAAQAWGKMNFSLDELRPDYLTLAGHKIGALSGIGILIKSDGAPLSPLILGKQEIGRRGGTENVIGAFSLKEAIRCLPSSAQWADWQQLRDEVEGAICSNIPEAIVNGQGAPRVPGTLNVCFRNIEGESLVMALDLAGYCVSSGSACASGVLEPSHVLLAMGRSKAEALSAIRVSWADEIAPDDRKELMRFVDQLGVIVNRIRKQTTDYDRNDSAASQFIGT